MKHFDFSKHNFSFQNDFLMKHLNFPQSIKIWIKTKFWNYNLLMEGNLFGFFSVKGKILNHHKPPSSSLAYLSLTAQKQKKNHLQSHFFLTPKRELWKLIMMINFLTWFLSCLCHWPSYGNPALNHALKQTPTARSLSRNVISDNLGHNFITDLATLVVR